MMEGQFQGLVKFPMMKVLATVDVVASARMTRTCRDIHFLSEIASKRHYILLFMNICLLVATYVRNRWNVAMLGIVWASLVNTWAQVPCTGWIRIIINLMGCVKGPRLH